MEIHKMKYACLFLLALWMPIVLHAQSHLTTLTYWIDDYANVQTSTISDGNIQFDIDVSSLCKGIHTFSYQVLDDTGLRSAPRLIYFLIPDLEEGSDLVAAYEYWFNRGPRTRVEFQPASPVVSLDNAVIEIKDIVPNTLDGYRFDAIEERAEVDDDVVFGIQVYDAGNRSSQAIISDTFHMSVPINLNMLFLRGDGTPLTVESPIDGRMQGMKSETIIGDSLVYTLSSQNVTADFYDAEGNQLPTNMNVLETGEVVYTLTATTSHTYVLIYNSFDARKDLSISLSAQTTSGISTVSPETATEVARYNINGQIIGSKQRGVNIIRMSDGSVRKVIIK